MASTGSAVRFELFKNDTGAFRVVGSYVSATMQQHRFNEQLNSTNPPKEMVFLNMTLPEFQDLVLRNIDSSCMAADLQKAAAVLRGSESSGGSVNGADLQKAAAVLSLAHVLSTG